MSQTLIIPYSWQGLDYTPRYEDAETGEITWGRRKYRIFIWGHDQFNDPVCWIVENYCPYCYVRLDAKIENEEQHAPLIMEALNNNLMEYVRVQSNKPNKSYLKALARADKIILGYIVENRRPMFYWNTRKDNIYKVFFNLETAMSLCYEYLDKNSIVMANGFKIPASSFNNGQSDRIPTEEKLIVEMNLERCSWFYATTSLVEHDGLTTLNKEYIVNDYRSMQMLPSQIAYKLGYPKPSTISFDAETFSEVFTRFPKATRLNDVMYALGFRHRVYRSITDDKPMIHNYIFVIWDDKTYGPLEDFSHIYGPMTYIYCLTETEFYQRLFHLLIRLDPTFIISFNGLGFDWPYIEDRCSILGIKVPNLSRIRGWFKTQFIKKKWKKWVSTWPQYPGRIDVDMLNLIRTQMKFNSYKLKNVAKELLPKGHDKIELPYKEQFRIFAAKEIDGMNKIMDYLLTDILLPEELYDVLNTAVFLHTNGSVMRVNPICLYTEGQSIRCICQLHSETEAEGMYIDSRTIWKAGKYIGGLVVDPISGVSEKVFIFDWNSLYPSRMKASNICFTTLINEKEEASKPEEVRIPDTKCHVVEGDIPMVDKKTKEIISIDHHRFRYISKSIYVGLLPKMVTKLNDRRGIEKKEMANCYATAKKFEEELKALRAQLKSDQEKEDAKEEIDRLTKLVRYWTTQGDIANAKQAAVKVAANSIYGFMGMKSGKFSFIEGGMSTTIDGRHALEKTLDIVKTKFGATIVYGDSVTGNTPLLLRLNQTLIHFITIEQLFTCPGQFIPEITGKEYKVLDDSIYVEVWSDKGWTKIQNIMRHATRKKIYRVLTNTGYVEVTEDHSLLRENGTEVTPKDVRLGDKLMQSYPTEFNIYSIQNNTVEYQYQNDSYGEEVIEIEGQLNAAKEYYTLKAKGFNVSINTSSDKLNIYKLTSSKNLLIDGVNAIKKIELLPRQTEEVYVYDLTTENHHFQAGIGSIIVHNTDSVMVRFPKGMIHKRDWKKSASEIAEYIGAQFEDEMNIAIENFLLRFFAVTKKRYAGIKVHPKTPGIFPSIEDIYDLNLFYIKGLITVRGNSCGIVYDNFDPFMLKMLLKVPTSELFDFIHEACLKIMRREYPLLDYRFVQKLGPEYKNKSAEMAVFSDRLKQRGRSHMPGEELEYVYAKTYGDCLKGFKMQAPDLFVDDNNVLDTAYYVTNKLAKPLEQLLTSVYDDSILTPSEKKIIRPRKPTSVQKVTPHWHLELYIQKYVAYIHANWEAVMNDIKFVRELAETNGYLNYVIGEEHVAAGMMSRYGVAWSPSSDEKKIVLALQKTPIHRHRVWSF